MGSIRKTDNRYRAEICKNNIRKSKRFDTKREAQSWILEQETTIEKGGFVANKNKKLADALHIYMELEAYKKKSYKAEVNRLKKMMTWDIAQKLINDIQVYDLNFLRDEKLRYLSSASVNRELTSMRMAIKYVREQLHWTHNDPFKSFKFPKEPRPRDRLISHNEIEVLLNALQYDNDAPIHFYKDEVAIAFLLALETAMRQGEIWSLKWENVYLDKKYLRLFNTKNGDNRDVALSRRALELLEKMQSSSIKNIKRQEYVFKSNQDSALVIFRRIIKKTDIQDLKFHDTRHEAITRLSKKLGVLALARMIGHRDIKSLMIYYNETAQEIAAMLD